MKAVQIGKAFIINDYDGSEIERVSCYRCEQAADLCRRINSHDAMKAALESIREKLSGDEFHEWTDQGLSDEGDTVFGYVYKPEATAAAIATIDAALADAEK